MSDMRLKEKSNDNEDGLHHTHKKRMNSVVEYPSSIDDGYLAGQDILCFNGTYGSLKTHHHVHKISHLTIS
jgi:hypothetical protein